MPKAADIQWFKTEFAAPIAVAIAGTPLTLDFLAALACQETGEVWPILRRRGLPTAEILELCVGDTLDEDRGRRAFPRTKAALIAVDRGQQMFDLAHQSLVDMAVFIPSYAAAASRPNKFCHAFGIFQLDLQFFKTDPDYFLQRRYTNFDASLERCMEELRNAVKKLGLKNRTDLNDLELAAIGICYNTGSYNPAKGLRQGFENEGRFYGENLFDFIRLCHTIAVDDAVPQLMEPAAGEAILASPTALSGAGAPMKVSITDSMLRVRSEPNISNPPQANVIANLPDGHPVRRLSKTPKNGFIEIETSLSGAHIQGFSSKKFLVDDGPGQTIEVVAPATVRPTTGIVAVSMPRKGNTVTRRKSLANALSLNEPGQPSRQGTTPEQLRSELGAIVEWLAVDNAEFLRYQPRSGLTFCNIYVHDFCTLAGVYVPRVWWNAPALVKLAAGKSVEPLLESTIYEMRANDLFRWLRDFGARFGWRQTGTLTKLQTEVNQGGVGIIVARRKEDGRSGHIVVVVPETPENSARRDAKGEVVAPLQSQSGASNFQYGRGKTNWWNGEEFAEGAFWIHA